jgi:large subunit ribosomal protein L18
MTAKRKTPFQRRKLGTRAKLNRVNIARNATRAIRPRLSVHRTNKQIYAQIIDDVQGVTLAAASSIEKEAGIDKGHTVDAAEKVGKLVAERASKAGVKKVQFDRGGFVYHGRVKALADGARSGGLEF